MGQGAQPSFICTAFKCSNGLNAMLLLCRKEHHDRKRGCRYRTSRRTENFRQDFFGEPFKVHIAMLPRKVRLDSVGDIGSWHTGLDNVTPGG